MDLEGGQNRFTEVTSPARKFKMIVTVGETLAGLALHSRLKINEKEIPKNRKSTTGSAVSNERIEKKENKTALRNIINHDEWAKTKTWRDPMA